jgi:IclR family mhp operon transcriptional activator
MDRAASPNFVRSLSKGLSVLVAVNERPPARIASLVKATGLPKPTLIRILNTLVAEGYVVAQSRQEGGGYRPAPKVRLLAGAFAHGSLLAQLARPLLLNLSLLVKWPAEILVPDGLSMLIEATSRDVAPIGLKRFEQTRFPLLSSSAGLVYLAWQPPNEQKEMIEAALALGETRDGRRLTADHIRQRIVEIRSRGWDWRDYEAPIEGTRAISVPVLLEERAIATITVVTLRGVLMPNQFEARVLPHLRQSAEELARQYARHSPPTLPSQAQTF